jgi:hypothetical protein
MKYTIEMASDGMIYLPSFMKTGLDMQILLMLFPQNSEKL